MVEPFNLVHPISFHASLFPLPLHDFAVIFFLLLLISLHTHITHKGAVVTVGNK